MAIRGFEPKPCEECGMEPVHHGLERLSLSFEFIVSRIFRPFVSIGRFAVPFAERIINSAGPKIAAVLQKMGLVVQVEEIDSHFSETAAALWQEAVKRKISIYELRLLGLPRSLFVSRHNGRSFVFQGLPRTARWQPSLLWMDNKAEMKKKFIKAGFPVAKGGLAATETGALKLFRKLQVPIIVKPYEGSSGRHTTVHIDTEEKLRAAFRNARLVAPFVIVEEELLGPVFRATIVNGKLAGVLRRDPPQIIGDGKSTIRELVAKENENPLRRGPVFAEIQPDSGAGRAELARQEFTPESLPAKGKTVYFHFKVNWGVGGTSRDATAETHPENKRLFEDIGKYLGDDIVGIDFMIEDISRPWQSTERCGVIELNSLPQLGNHHYPYTGPVQNVAGAVWDMIYPESAATDQN